MGTLGDSQLQSVNSITAQAGPVIQNPAGLRDGCTSSYGMTIDSSGRIWLSGWDCPDAIGYSPSTQGWCRARLPFDMPVGRGMTSDSEGRIWTALGGDGQSQVALWNASDCVDGQSFPVHHRIQTPVSPWTHRTDYGSPWAGLDVALFEPSNCTG